MVCNNVKLQNYTVLLLLYETILIIILQLIISIFSIVNFRILLHNCTPPNLNY